MISAYGISTNEIDLSIPNQFCKALLEELNIPFYDLTAGFQSSTTFPFFSHDEHLNATGHRLIALHLAREFSTESGRYELISTENCHERYPTRYADSTLLYQSQSHDHYFINFLDLNTHQRIKLWEGIHELVHPVMTRDKRYLAFTDGDQTHNETDVVLFDNITQQQTRLNAEGYYAAIPMFSPDGSLIAFPEWKKGKSTPHIVILHLSSGKRKQFLDGAECWRPIFSNDQTQLYYIQKTNPNCPFVIKSYNLKSGKTSVVLQQPYDIWDIALSPSGRYLAYAGRKSHNWDIYLFDLQTKHIRQLTQTLGDEWDPAFGSNDYELWFAGVFGFNEGIVRMQIP